MIATNNKLFEHMTTLSDTVRCRLLVLLAQELTVSDLCAVMQLPQSTVSRHLKTLHDRGWVESRPDGTRRLYRRTIEELEDGAKKLWDLAGEELLRTSAGRGDAERLASVLARRRSRSREFFDASGANWDALRDELFGAHFYSQALLGLLESEWVVADLGCGTGAVAESLAPFVRGVIGIDGSNAMLDIAEKRLGRFGNVELRVGELESLPLDDDSVDVATLMLVLHHVEQPDIAIREAARVLRPGGKILIVDMAPHDRSHYVQEMGHTWLGFSEEDICSQIKEAGFGEERFQSLPPVPEAKGPNLFAVTANKRRD